MKVTWACVNKGSVEHPEVRCRLIAQESGFGERLVGCPSLAVVRLSLSVSVEQDSTILLLDVTCAFVYGELRRNVYIEFPRHAPRYADGQ